MPTLQPLAAPAPQRFVFGAQDTGVRRPSTMPGGSAGTLSQARRIWAETRLPGRDRQQFWATALDQASICADAVLPSPFRVSGDPTQISRNADPGRSCPLRIASSASRTPFIHGGINSWRNGQVQFQNSQHRAPDGRRAGYDAPALAQPSGVSFKSSPSGASVIT